MSIITVGLLGAIVVLGVLAARATGSRLDAALAGASLLSALVGVTVSPVSLAGASIQDAGLLVIASLLLVETRGVPFVVARRSRVLGRANQRLYDQRLCHAVAKFEDLHRPREDRWDASGGWSVAVRGMPQQASSGCAVCGRRPTNGKR